MSAHVRDQLSAYLDGELSPPERTLVAEHLASCEECSRRLQALGVVDAAARELPAEAPARYFAAFPSRVRRRLEGGTRERSWRMPAWTWAAAAAALLAVVAPLTLMRARPPGGSPPEEKALPTPGFAATPPAAPAEAPAPTVLARPAPRPAEAPAQMAEQEARTEQNASQPPALAGGRAASTDVAAPLVSGAASPGVPPPFSTPSPLPASRGTEPKAALAAPALAPPSEKDEAKPPAAASAPTEGETGTLQKVRTPVGEEQRTRERGQPEALPDTALRRAAPRAAGDADRLYRTLLFRSALTLQEARELREAWRSFSRLHPEGAPADEARVRVVEAGAQAYRFGADPEDLARLRDDARAYLERKDAAQAARVGGILDALGLQP